MTKKRTPKHANANYQRLSSVQENGMRSIWQVWVFCLFGSTLKRQFYLTKTFTTYYVWPRKSIMCPTSTILDYVPVLNLHYVLWIYTPLNYRNGLDHTKTTEGKDVKTYVIF